MLESGAPFTAAALTRRTVRGTAVPVDGAACIRTAPWERAAVPPAAGASALGACWPSLDGWQLRRCLSMHGALVVAESPPQ
eukprot:scaffold4454_cov411-Prasinococcus_capsulatus_cf.AAC.12